MFALTPFARHSSALTSPAAWIDDLVGFAPLLRSGHGDMMRRSMPSFEMEEGETEYTLSVSLPVQPENVEIKTRDGTLTISGHEDHEDESTDDQGFKRITKSSSSFSRSFPLPDGVDPTSITAERSADGKLVIAIPKPDDAPAARATPVPITHE